ncbi:hypothetical protein BD309DRAFT_713925 [Dichomitus squalens]|nr:hypothetical protein BD309DRAFT_713925 [Dichomitus squalens]
MARTKQTARQSTGDIAPRGSLVAANDVPMEEVEEEEEVAPKAGGRPKRTRQQTGAKAAKAAKEPVIKADELGSIIVVDDHDNFCYACQNGGSTIMCDFCPRILCMKHVPAIAELQDEIRNLLVFMCPHCHIMRTRNEKDVSPYYGTTNAYFPKWIDVDITNSRPQHARVDTQPIVICSIRLASLDDAGSPARVMYTALEPYFQLGPGCPLRYIDIPFDLETVQDAIRYRAAWDKEIGKLGLLTNARILLFIYTHSHEETGDLFFAREGCSDSISDWWDQLVSKRLRGLGEKNHLTIIMLACGALLDNKRTKLGLKMAAESMNAQRVIAFAAKAVQAVLTAPFFLVFAHRVLLEGIYMPDKAIIYLLDQSLFLARHSAVWIFERSSQGQALSARIYQWTDETMRPNGEDVGLQCPGCGSLSSRIGNLGEKQAVILKCQKKDCRWKKIIDRPEGMKNVCKSAEGGIWTVRDAGL